MAPQSGDKTPKVGMAGPIAVWQNHSYVRAAVTTIYFWLSLGIRFRSLSDWKKVIPGTLLDFESTTMAVHVPVYLPPSECWRLPHPFRNIPGIHRCIDILSVENGRVVLWGFVVDAETRQDGLITSLALSANMLSIQTGIPMERFVCGYFDTTRAVAFFPDLNCLVEPPLAVKTYPKKAPDMLLKEFKKSGMRPPAGMKDSATFTWNLFRGGRPIPEIARYRGLTEQTIGNHLKEAVRCKVLSIDWLLLTAEREQILRVWNQIAPEFQTYSRFRQLYGQDCPLWKLECALDWEEATGIRDQAWLVPSSNQQNPSGQLMHNHPGAPAVQRY